MSTLTQLKASIDAWLARDDVAVSGDDFDEILLIAEARIARKVRTVIQETSDTITFTGRRADLPTDYLEPRNPFIDDNVRKFEYKTPQALRESSGWNNGRAGAAYTFEGNGVDRVQMVLASPATTSDPLNVDILYWARFAALVNDGDTNWLLANHFDVYLYITLHAAGVYLQETLMADKYKMLADEALEELQKSENRKRYGAMPKQAYGHPRTIV